jgi:hypothetical protein
MNDAYNGNIVQSSRNRWDIHADQLEYLPIPVHAGQLVYAVQGCSGTDDSLLSRNIDYRILGPQTTVLHGGDHRMQSIHFLEA